MTHRLDIASHPYLVRVAGLDGGRFSNLDCAIDSARDAQYQMLAVHHRRVEWEIVDGARRWTSDMAVAG